MILHSMQLLKTFPTFKWQQIKNNTLHIININNTCKTLVHIKLTTTVEYCLSKTK